MINKKNSWNPQNYTQFLDARTRPARDLLATIPQNFEPNLIYDLGCGPGNSTILLKERWPQSEIIGLDSSERMLTSARNTYPELSFIQGDITEFTAPKKIDLIFSNASLQWVSQHEKIISQLASQLNPLGILAIQMPNNFHSPSHQTILKVLESKAEWKPLLKKMIFPILFAPMYQVSNYYNMFSHADLTDITIWETEYYLEVATHKTIYEWISGTALTPILHCLNEEDKALFAEKYLAFLAEHFPLQDNGKVLFPFRRLFMIGSKIN